MNLLYLSHCAPDAANKGEKIRAFHLLREMQQRFRVHLVCFGRTDAEVAAVHAMEGCASVYAEKLSPRSALLRAGWSFLRGRCLTTNYFASAAMRRHVSWLSRTEPLDATIAYTTAMAPYAPDEIPVILDMSDVDSEKWFQYAAMRRGAFLFAAEGRRLRQEEILHTARARHTIVMTAQERNLLRSFSPSATISYVENGVDFDSFDPASVSPPPGLRSRKFLAFIGYMDYYPNVQAVVWFADHVFGCLQKRIPDLEFAIVGRNPRASVLALARRPGIWVAPQPSDVRPYLMASAGVVAPLHLARGIQNKVLEALAMGKTVFASTPICSTFGPDLPAGIVQCRDTAEFIRRISAVSLRPAASDPSIRAAAQARFSWPRALDSISQTVLATVDSARSMEKV